MIGAIKGTELINKQKELRDSDIKELKKWDIEPDGEKYKAYINKNLKYATDRIDKCKTELEEAEQRLEQITEG